MKKLVFYGLILLFPGLSLANAVDALRSYIPFYRHEGVNDIGEKCSIDFFFRSDRKLMVEFMNPRLARFLLSPEDQFERQEGFFMGNHPEREENGGLVTMSLVFRGTEVQIQRRFCTEERCWVSGNTCLLNTWK